jgi:hypothetical protein
MDMPTSENIVLQTFDDGRYCSGLLSGRYQIFASRFYEGQFTIFDHKIQEVIRSKSGDYFRLFNSVQEAEQFLGVDANSVPALTNKKGEKRMKAAMKIAAAKIAKSAPKMAAKASTRKRGESALSYLKELIKTNSALSDNDIAAMVQAKFPESKYNHSMVKFNRKKMGV